MQGLAEIIQNDISQATAGYHAQEQGGQGRRFLIGVEGGFTFPAQVRQEIITDSKSQEISQAIIPDAKVAPNMQGHGIKIMYPIGGFQVNLPHALGQAQWACPWI